MNTADQDTRPIKTSQLLTKIRLFQENNTMHRPEKVSAAEPNGYLAKINKGGVNEPR